MTSDTTTPSSLSRSGTSAEEVILGYQRSPVDLLRLCTFAFVAAAVTVVMITLEDSVVRLEGDVVQLVDRLPATIVRIIHGSLEWLGLVVLATIVLVPLITKRYRLFGYVFVADAVAVGLMTLVLWLVDRSDAQQIVAELTRRDGITVATTTGELGVAAWAASFIVLGPFVSARWRRAGTIALGAMIVIRLVVSHDLPGNVIIALPVGATAGVGVLCAFGRPDRRPSVNAIRLALSACGLDARDVRVVDTGVPGSTRCDVTLADGQRLDAKVSGSERRAADLLNRLYRFVRLRDAGDARPYASLQQGVEHESLIGYAARDAGVATPRVRGVAPVGLDSVVIAHDHVDGRPLGDLDAEHVDDETIRDVFRQVAAMRRRRIAHRRLGPATIVVGADGGASLVDFTAGELAVADPLLDSDTSQTLATIALVVGPERAVAGGVEELGQEAVADALPLLQMQALPASTRAALRHRKGLLDEVQQQVQRQTGVEEIQLAQLDRFDKKTLLMLVVLAAATYFLLPQFANLPDMVDRLGQANWWWLPAILGFSALTYIGAAASIAGAVPPPLRPGPLTASQLAASFTGTLAPAGVGGMALNLRFLQKQGVDRAVAVSGVGLTSVTGVLVHTSLLGVFIVWAGRSAFSGYSLPNPEWLLVGLAVVIALAGVALLVPATQRLLRDRVWPIMRRAFDGVSTVLRSPTKVMLLFGGSAFVTFGNLLALYFSVVALGGGLPLASVGAVYLVGASVASVAPTPGGIGAIEAALVSGLVAAGLANAAAVPAVILYRLITFWLPNLPGWIAFRWLQRHDYI